MPKNLTLSLDDELLDAMKLIAARRRTSVNAMVRGFLQSEAAKERAKDEARESLLRLARERQGDMGSQKWSREAVYDR